MEIPQGQLKIFVERVLSISSSHNRNLEHDLYFLADIDGVQAHPYSLVYTFVKLGTELKDHSRSSRFTNVYTRGCGEACTPE
jgi:hypothetical protein